MTIAETLQKARDLISDPAKWCTGAFAKDANGAYVGSRSPEACKWCAVGAVGKVGGGYEAIDFLERDRDPIFVNDSKGHAATLAMFDAAIAEAKLKEVANVPS